MTFLLQPWPWPEGVACHVGQTIFVTEGLGQFWRERHDREHRMGFTGSGRDLRPSRQQQCKFAGVAVSRQSRHQGRLSAAVGCTMGQAAWTLLGAASASFEGACGFGFGACACGSEGLPSVDGCPFYMRT